MGLYYHERVQLATMLRRYIREESEMPPATRTEWFKILRKFEDDGILALTAEERRELQILFEQSTE